VCIACCKTVLAGSLTRHFSTVFVSTLDVDQVRICKTISPDLLVIHPIHTVCTIAAISVYDLSVTVEVTTKATFCRCIAMFLNCEQSGEWRRHINMSDHMMKKGECL
jgi:hypothetical protein